MVGGEIVAAGKAVEKVGKKILDQNEKTDDALLKLAEDTLELKDAARSKAARIAVKERIKLKIYKPFALMLGVSRAYFEERFPEEMGEKTANIPDNHLITPSASVAVPAMQALAYSFEESNLKEMFLNLLTTASDDRTAQRAHPAFTEVIKQLSPAETEVLISVLRLGNGAIARLKKSVNPPDSGYVTVLTHLMSIRDTDTDTPVINDRTSMWVDNWIRLGLVTVDYDRHFTDPKSYDWVIERPEYQEVKVPEPQKLLFDKGVIEATSFGVHFLAAVT